MVLKQITLWSWLTTQEASTEIICPPDLQVTSEEFAMGLASGVGANRLPAEVELCEVTWDDTDTKQTRILIRHTGGADMIQFLVGVDQMGAFAYVEEKVFLKPPPPSPKLPKPSRKKKPCGKEPPGLSGPIVLAILGASLILFAAVVLLSYVWPDSSDFLTTSLCVIAPSGAGVFVIFLAFRDYQMLDAKIAKWQETMEWNRKVDGEYRAWKEVQIKWEQTLDDWYQDALRAAHLTRTDNVYGRFTQAVSTTVKQAIKTLFEDRQAELRKRTEKERTQEEIEEQLERRKREGFR